MVEHHGPSLYGDFSLGTVMTKTGSCTDPQTSISLEKSLTRETTKDNDLTTKVVLSCTCSFFVFRSVFYFTVIDKSGF